MSYVVTLRPIAERERRRLPNDVRVRVNRALLDLEQNPRPPGARKLVGPKSRWRIRIGDYRVIYTIDDEAQIVEVLRIAHRREVYR